MRSRRPETAAALVLAGLLVGGCAGGAAPGGGPGGGAAPRTGPVEMRVSRPGGVLRARIEALAARCWLDAELGAEALGVDRRTGRIVAAGATGELLTVAVADAPGGAARVRMTGPALSDPGRRARMADALSRVMEGPEPAC